MRELQADLNKFGAHLTVDGNDGPLTTSALKSFQSKHGLTADGVAGPLTWRALGACSSPTPRPTPTPVRTCPATVQQGSNGAAVKELQNDLNKNGYHVTVDGNDGPLTTSALKNFQSKHHLAVDGIAGPATWHALGAC